MLREAGVPAPALSLGLPAPAAGWLSPTTAVEFEKYAAYLAWKYGDQVDNWATLNDMDLRLTVSARRVASDHATEFGAFEQSFRDSSGARMTEYGRYVTVLARGPDETWRIDRFLGFADSTRRASPRP